MNAPDWVALGGIAAIIVSVEWFFHQPFSRRLSAVAPEPFWIYFLSILGGVTGVFPATSPVYVFISTYILPTAIFLMLVGSPITLLLKLGSRASLAMVLAAVTMVIAIVVGYGLFHGVLPDGAWRAAGALLGTWVGGSANMVAVKEILDMPDSDLAPLVIVDTILSYAWLALLLLGPAFQKRFDHPSATADAASDPLLERDAARLSPATAIAVAVGLGVATFCVFAGRRVGAVVTAIPPSGWALLLATLVAMGAALTPVRRVEALGASIVGRWALYVVLATIGAKTRIEAASAAPVYLAFGAVVLFTHGILTLALGRALRLPLFLLSTASQANVGGAVSAPIVAEAYRPGTPSIGVMMAVAGTLCGTYVGLFGGWGVPAVGRLVEMRAFPRWVPILEVAAFYALVHGVMWLSGEFRPTILVVALLMVALCLGSNKMHGDSLERRGFDPRHFWPCLRLTAAITLPLLAPLLILGWTKRFDWPHTLLFDLVGYPIWSFAQEYALLAFVNNRLEEGLEGHERLLPWVNAFLFSMAHLPNPVLMVTTFIAGGVFTWIFRRHRHLIPIALAHAAVGIGITLAFADVHGIMSVGPGYATRVGHLRLTN